MAQKLKVCSNLEQVYTQGWQSQEVLQKIKQNGYFSPVLQGFAQVIWYAFFRVVTVRRCAPRQVFRGDGGAPPSPLKTWRGAY